MTHRPQLTSQCRSFDRPDRFEHPWGNPISTEPIGASIGTNRPDRLLPGDDPTRPNTQAPAVGSSSPALEGSLVDCISYAFGPTETSMPPTSMGSDALIAAVRGSLSRPIWRPRWLAPSLAESPVGGWAQAKTICQASMVDVVDSPLTRSPQEAVFPWPLPCRLA